MHRTPTHHTAIHLSSSTSLTHLLFPLYANLSAPAIMPETAGTEKFFVGIDFGAT
jgi:hypothetical protein